MTNKEMNGEGLLRIWDRDGNELNIEDYRETHEIPMTRGTDYPTQIKWLKKNERYNSEKFSGKGRRYGGYSFAAQNGGKKYKIGMSLGGFGLWEHAAAAHPSDIATSYNLPIANAPYTIETHRYFFLGVDNPKNGQTYNVTAL